MTEDDELTAAERRLRDHLVAQADARGKAIVEVAGDRDGAPYTFSVGAWQRLGVPEAVTIGLPEGVGSQLIDTYVERASQGEKFSPGQVWDDLLEGVLVTVERVNKGHYFEFFGSAFLVHPEGDFEAVQLITATPQDYWPWEADGPPGFALWQPILTESGVPESWTPGVDGP
ncbi:DUF4262 domain-containing protein [Actinophytocola oryzae]|uniref:Uncharacterized protein DUF4262 n=1 Tax=Actinophytocola oryzae TaxID=502181 RepID=A0A4R7VHR7_9PSEU|nr:DUF4262 domain-containing protein [Actinophytocola oryzae]TDV48903.1 uncharacterized protein DUF4262 [Actinophytocola oryzae]